MACESPKMTPKVQSLTSNSSQGNMVNNSTKEAKLTQSKESPTVRISEKNDGITIKISTKNEETPSPSLPKGSLGICHFIITLLIIILNSLIIKLV